MGARECHGGPGPSGLSRERSQSMRHATPAQRSRSPLLRWGTTAAAALIALSIASPAQAGRRPSPDTPAPAPTPVVVAEGLDNPRQLSFGSDGDLFVAEAGRGGAGPCFPSPEDPTATVCFGLSGAITRISDRGQRRVVPDLPSIAAAGAGTQAIGPSDVLADRRGDRGLGEDTRPAGGPAPPATRGTGDAGSPWHRA